jgi:hypothetical protein
MGTAGTPKELRFNPPLSLDFLSSLGSASLLSSQHHLVALLVGILTCLAKVL